MKDKFKKPRSTGRRRKAKGKGKGKSKINITRVKGNIIPDKMIVHIPYLDYQKVNSAGGPANNYFQKTYSLNSIYDPEPGALNTYPLGYQEYATLYRKYRVFAASYEITLWNGSDDTSVIGAMYIADAGGTGGMNSDISSWLLQPRARQISLGNKSGGRSQVTYKGKVYLPGFAGMTSEQYRTSVYTEGGLAIGGGVSPLTDLRLFINLANTNSGVTTANVYASCKITYHAEVYERAQFVTAKNLTDGDTADGGEEPHVFPPA